MLFEEKTGSSVRPLTFEYVPSGSSLKSDRKYKCCCLHVEKWTLLFAWLSVLLTSGWIVYQVSTADDIGRICTSIISLIVDAMLIFALQKRRPSLFLPFIILEGLSLIKLLMFSILLTILLAIIFYCGPNELSMNIRDILFSLFMNELEERQVLQSVYTIAITVPISWLCSALVAFIFYVDWMTWHYLHEEKKARRDEALRFAAMLV